MLDIPPTLVIMCCWLTTAPSVPQTFLNFHAMSLNLVSWKSVQVHGCPIHNESAKIVYNCQNGLNCSLVASQLWILCCHGSYSIGAHAKLNASSQITVSFGQFVIELWQDQLLVCGAQGIAIYLLITPPTYNNLFDFSVWWVAALGLSVDILSSSVLMIEAWWRELLNMLLSLCVKLNSC